MKILCPFFMRREVAEARARRGDEPDEKIVVKELKIMILQ
jgi:hypothetical protein